MMSLCCSTVSASEQPTENRRRDSADIVRLHIGIFRRNRGHRESADHGSVNFLGEKRLHFCPNGSCAMGV